MAYVRKTRDEFEMLSNYGYGWEVECTEDSRAAVKAQIQCYRENCPQGSYTWRKRRVKIEN